MSKCRYFPVSRHITVDKKYNIAVAGTGYVGLSLGTLPSMIATGMNPFINAQGYAIIGMLSVAVGAVANIILDPIFIFVLDMEIKGAAIATVISQILSALLVFYFLHGKSELKVRWLHINEISECTRHARDIISLERV